MRGARHPAQRRDDVVGADGAAVREEQVGAKLEGVGVVVGVRPMGGQRGAHVELGVEADEPLEKVPVDLGGESLVAGVRARVHARSTLP